MGSSRKVGGATKGLGEAPKSCTRKEHESATNSIAKRGQGAIAPCRVKGQRPLWGLGQRPNSSTGDQYAKRAQQRCRQRSVPASNFARPQTRPQAALPPRFREEPKSESKNPAGQAAQFRFQPGIFMHLVEVNPLIFARTEAKSRRAFDGVDAVAALDALQHVLLPRVVRRGVHHVHAGLVDGNRVE